MHLLVVEPRLEGHHLSWLRYVAEDFLYAGHRLTLAIDGRQQAAQRYQEALGDILNQVATVSIINPGRGRGSGARTAALGACFACSRAQHVFINNLDDIASSMLRRAALGIYPPHHLKGKLSGVYFRPRFLANPLWPLGNAVKQFGFRRLIGQGWFHRVCLVDEYLFQRHERRDRHSRLTFLPDTWSGDFSMTEKQAREDLGIAANRFVFLHYGIGTRRKGLHLVVRAMLAANRPERWHLLCAGQLSNDRQINRGIRQLAAEGCATVLNRYVSKGEEQACFAASDVVLLPYVRHFGSSGVLALSAAAGKMVVASDEGLIARRVREKGLGICFTSGSARALRSALSTAEQMLGIDPQRYANAARQYAGQCGREAFRKALTAIYDKGGQRSSADLSTGHGDDREIDHQ